MADIQRKEKTCEEILKKIEKIISESRILKGGKKKHKPASKKSAKSEKKVAGLPQIKASSLPQATKKIKRRKGPRSLKTSPTELYLNTVTQLRKLAKERKITGYSKMKKKQLIKVLGGGLPKSQQSMGTNERGEFNIPLITSAREMQYWKSFDL